MKFFKKDSQRYLDPKLKAILGRKLYESGMYTLDMCEEMVTDDFDMSTWIDDIISNLKQGKLVKPSVERHLSIDTFEHFLFMENEERMNRAYDCLEIFNQHGYLKYSLDVQTSSIVINLPHIFQSLTEWATKQIWLNMKSGKLPLEFIRPLLTKEQIEHYASLIHKLKDDKDRKLALYGDKSYRNIIKPLTESDIDEDSEIESESELNSETEGEVDSDNDSNSESDFDSDADVDLDKKLEQFANEHNALVVGNLELQLYISKGGRYMQGKEEITKDEYHQLLKKKN